eukprot:3896806-Prymnesium_polylepis.1
MGPDQDHRDVKRVINIFFQLRALVAGYRRGARAAAGMGPSHTRATAGPLARPRAAQVPLTVFVSETEIRITVHTGFHWFVAFSAFTFANAPAVACPPSPHTSFAHLPVPPPT